MSSNTTPINFSDLTPSAPAGSTNVKWQCDGNVPINISAYIPAGSISNFVYIGPLSGIPVTATVGQLAFITDAIAGQNIYEATATNVFTQQLAGIPAGPSTSIQSNNGGIFGG